MASLTDNGSLSTGVYQFCYRFVKNEDIGTTGAKDIKYSKFTTPTFPVNITNKSQQIFSSNGQPYTVVDKRIRMSVPFNSEESAFYTHYQVCVLVRTDGQNLPPDRAYLLPPVSLTGLTSPDTFEFGSNIEYEEYPITEIVTEDSAIESFGAIQSKNNIMFGGDASYRDLTFPSNWTFNKNTCSVIKQSVGRGYNNTDSLTENELGYGSDFNSHKYRSYFRDEVYRFGISYVDKYGNWSKVKVLDFTGATNNKATSSPDWRFPDRGDGDVTGGGNDYTIFNSSGDIDAIGLRITDIDYHPTWAVGFKIVRAKRKKNILFQSPLVSVSRTEALKASTNYPKSGTSPTLGDPDGILVPKDFSYPWARNLIRGANETEALKYQHQAAASPETYVHIVFPPEEMYGNNNLSVDSYSIAGGNYFWNIVDAVGCKQEYSVFSTDPGSFGHGDYADTEATLSIVASAKNQYYYERNVTRPELSTLSPVSVKNAKILEYKKMSSGQDKVVLTSSVENLIPSNVGGHDDIKPSDATYLNPTNQDYYVIVSDSSLRDPSFASCDANGTGYSNDIVFSAGQISISSLYSEQKQELHTNTGVSNALVIVNVTAGLSDTRYGDVEEYHEFFDTGATYMFSPTEISTYVSQGATYPIDIDVWGGDCFISRHVLKVHDSVYRATYGAYSQAPTQWGPYYAIDVSSANLPQLIALKGLSANIQVYLESEVNSDAISRTICQKYGSGNEALIEGGGFEVRTPMTYEYNMTYSQGAYNKLFLTSSEFDKSISNLMSRIHYSDTKIYQTDVEGFDIFRVANIVDMEERHGKITSLPLATDNMYAFQDSAISYLPIQANIIETADAFSLSIRSAEVVGLPKYITTQYGCQHSKSVAISDSAIFFADKDNTMVFKMAGNQLMPISEIGAATFFNDKMPHISEDGLWAVYDKDRMEYILGHRYDNTPAYPNNKSNFGIIWSDKLNAWVTEIDSSIENSIWAASYDGGKVYVVGVGDSSYGTGDLELATYGTGTTSKVFYQRYDPYIQFVVNPDMPLPKTFDTVVIDANDPVKTYQLKVYRQETGSLLSYNTASYSMAIDPKEGLYKIKTLRNITSTPEYTTATDTYMDFIQGSTPHNKFDATTANDRTARIGQRMRGLHGLVTLKWDFDDTNFPAVNSVLHKYRISNRAI